ncbi:fosmidomycin resistance protein [Bacillus thuringiensis serovar malayensis]|uniref:VOC family protein n=1 Tax=Bacillus toyonensis TaxID=155322 RepID=UPI000B42D1BB|nr:VOC family protein [Bacillus toyonensis]MEC2389821.1 VOC family protein [Bacillus toyonensis]OTX28544.1 fosmidomycin resistance protein [Bacillus thuringiensis serovar malayensis]
MIKKIYETHLEVKSLNTSIDFYQNKLGLKLAKTSRNAVFFWIGDIGHQFLGLWEVPKDTEVKPRHFAFEVELDFLKRSKVWLEERGIKVIGSQGKSNEEPIVQTWIPAASVYFLDLDGNKLEFISMLEDTPKELDYVPYLSEWERVNE